MAGKKGCSGGARSGAGRPKAEPALNRSSALLTSDPKQFLTATMNDPESDMKLRVDAAKALLSAEIRTAEAKGKKGQAEEQAKKVASRFSASAPPLRVIGK